MERELPELIRRMRARFASEHIWPVDASLPEPILERLGSIEEAEQRRCAQLARDHERPVEPSERRGIPRINP